MATQNAFGSITIIDMTDIGQFTTVPMSSAGIVMIYDPNALSNNYTPASMNLTPYTTYGGEVLTSGVTYTWYKVSGNSAFDINNPGTATSTSSSVTVTSSDFSSVKNITYYLNARYNAPGNISLSSWGQISISLAQQATNIQDVEISGEHLFKYKYTTYQGNPIPDGSTSVELTAKCTSNVAVHRWYYYNSTTTPEWQQLTNSITGVTVNGSTCTIAHTANIFENNKAKIKVTTHRTDATSVELTNVFDEYEILKLYDGKVGAPGEGTVILRLTNEDQMIPCNGQGVPTAHAFDLAYTDIEVVDGGDDVTGDWIINCAPTGVTGSYNSTTHRYTVNGWANDNTSEVGYVTITATDDADNPSQLLTKIMSLTKIQTGEDGKSPTVYSLSITPNKVTTTYDNKTSSSTTLTASVTSHSVNPQTGAMITTDVTTSTSDVIWYQWFVNGNSSPSKSNAGSSGYQYTIGQGNTITSVTCVIRKVNQSGVQIDSQSVSFTPKGQKGETGATGDGAISLDFEQNTDTIGLNSSGELTSDYSLELPYAVYQGTTQLSAQAVNTVSKGYIFKINDLDFTGNNKGTITFGSTKVTVTIPSGTKVYDSTITGTNAHSLNGQCIIPINYSNAKQTAADGTVTNVNGTILATFSWNLDIAPENGSSVNVDSANSWTRYKRTSNANQPTITSSDAETIPAAQSGGTKPYYIWCCNHIAYTDGNFAEAYTVNFYPVDPVDGKTVQTSSSTTYQTYSSGTTIPSGTWSNSISTATSGKTKPYYLWTKTTTVFTWTTGGSAGADAVTYSTSYYPVDVYELTLQASTNIFQGSTQLSTITPIMSLNGAAYTPAANELTWAYVKDGTMTTVSSTSASNAIYRVDSGNTHQLKVTSGAVNGGTSIQCKFVKGSTTIYAYVTLEDYDDEFRCELLSTIGDKVTNHQGAGFVKCILYRNGFEIDKITAGPTIPSGQERQSGGVSPHAATVNVTREALPSDILSIAYAWSYQTLNNDGSLSPLSDNTYNASGKAIYIDGTMINRKILIDCVATVTYK